MLDLVSIEKLLSRQSNFCVVDWLLAENLLAYSAYEQWRQGRLEELRTAINLDDDQLIELLEQMAKQTQALQLQATDQTYVGWSQHAGMTLNLSKDAELNQQLGQRWQRPQDLMQPDLFMDNAAVITENLLIESLSIRNWTEAEKQLQQLSKLNTQHPQLGRYQDLLNYGQYIQDSPNISKDQLLNEWQGLEQEVCGLARELLGAAARDYLAMAWRRLADSLQGVEFDPLTPQLHSGFALARIPDWCSAEQRLLTEPQLYQQPVLILALIECTTALKQRKKTLLLWCRFLETFPEQAAARIEAMQPTEHSSISLLWEQFWQDNDSLPVSFFPAFVLLQQPGLLHHLHSIPGLTHLASQAMISLLQQKQTGGDEIDARRELQDVSPSLLRLYLHTEQLAK